MPFPSATERLDYELELGCVIGREGRDVAAADALDYIAGFCIFNDWSARDLQMDEMSVGLGPAKGKDSATTLGPWLVTTDEMAPYLRDGRLQVKCTVRVNGDVWLDEGDGGALASQLGRFCRARLERQPHCTGGCIRQWHGRGRLNPRGNHKGHRICPLPAARR